MAHKPAEILLTYQFLNLRQICQIEPLALSKDALPVGRAEMTSVPNGKCPAAAFFRVIIAELCPNRASIAATLPVSARRPLNGGFPPEDSAQKR